MIGNTTHIGGVITESSGRAAPVGSGFATTVVDNSPASPDRESPESFPAVPPTADTPDCGSQFASFTDPVTGDIVIADN